MYVLSAGGDDEAKEERKEGKANAKTSGLKHVWKELKGQYDIS